MSNVVVATFGALRTVRTRPLWKIDRGMVLQLVGLDLPPTYQVHFSNEPTIGTAKRVIATSDTVEIPFEYLQTGKYVYAWIYLTPEEDVGFTAYMVTIPVQARPEVSGEDPTPAQQDAIDDAIAALNAGVEQVEEIAEGIPQAITDALTEAKESGVFDGPQGEKGDAGEPGPKGDKGDKGDPGEPGEDGQDGAQGPKGDKGDKGDTGAAGQQGPKGDKGDTGATGPQGPQGPKGDKGDPGEVSQAEFDELAGDVGELKSQMGAITQKTRNMFDDAVLSAAGLTKESGGYWAGLVKTWNTAFSSLLPVAGVFEEGKRYTVSCKYYFSEVGSYTGNAMSIKVAYADETSANLFQFGSSNTTETSVSQTTSSTKDTDHLFTALTDGRANNYTLHIKDLQVEEGTSRTDYIPHTVVYDATVAKSIRTINDQIATANAHVDDVARNASTFVWEVGFYNSSNGAKQTTTETVRSINLIHLIAGTNVYIDGGYMYRLYRYTANDLSTFVEYYGYSYDSTLHYITGFYEITVTGWYGIVVTDYAQSTVTDAGATGAHLHIEPSIALNDLKDAVSLGIMPYNLAGLKTYIDAVNAMGGDVVLPIVTDIHGGYPDSYAVINYLANSGIGDYMFELGDVIKATFPTRAEAVAYMRESFHTMAYTKTNTPIIFLQGNHDTNPLSGTDTSKNITQEMFYGLSMARAKNVQQPVKKAYGYVDIDAAKVRVIYLNTSDIYDPTTGAALVTGQYTMLQQGQLDWFTGTALNLSDKAAPTDWSVIIMSHDSLSQIAGSAFGAILTAFMAGTTASGTQTVIVGTYSNVLTYNCDFTAQGGLDVICEVNGHHHKDMIRELGSTGIQQVYIACEGPASASYDDSGSTVYYDRERGTTDEHLIDTLVLDKANRTVYFKRFGVGEDREITY